MPLLSAQPLNVFVERTTTTMMCPSDYLHSKPHLHHGFPLFPLPSPRMPTTISIQSLTKSFGQSSPTGKQAGRPNAVDHVSLEIPAGQLFFLLGPSGCGKTTLLRMIAGFIEPTSGTILFNNQDVTSVAPNKRNTGMVFQSYALWPHMTVAANVAFGLDVRKVPADERVKRVAEALAAVRMSEYSERKPNQLSGGQQQRIALARALVIRPDVLLLDEPLSNLDAKLRIELRAEIRRVCKATGITTVYVTHDQKEALSMADRVAIMDAGKVVQVGGPAELYRRPASKFVAEFLGETNFILGTVINHTDQSTNIKTDAGILEIKSPTALQLGAAVTCSIRPEAFRLSDHEPMGIPGRGISGKVIDTTYLGEMAQHLVELPGGIRVKVADLNPATATRQESQVRLVVDPADVVLV